MESEEQKISIIVPVYNVQQYLHQCVDSLLEQDIKNYEIILIDDGSTDLSSEIVDEYANKDKKIKSIHKMNGGLGSARNAGIKVSKGKYILFVDSDDYLEKNCLSKMLGVAEQNDLDILLFGAHSFADDNNEIINNYIRHKAKFNTTRIGLESIKNDFENNEYFASVCLRMYNRNYILSTGYFFNEKYIHEDEDFSFLSYIQAKKVQIIPQTFYQRRYRGGSILTEKSFEKSFKGLDYAAESIFRHSSELDENQKKICLYYYERLVLYVVTKYCRLDNSQRKRNKKVVQDFLKKHKNLCKSKSIKLNIAYKSITFFDVLYHIKRFFAFL